MERLQKPAIREIKTGTKVTFAILKPPAEILGKYFFEEGMRSYRRSKLKSRRKII